MIAIKEAFAAYVKAVHTKEGEEAIAEAFEKLRDKCENAYVSTDTMIRKLNEETVDSILSVRQKNQAAKFIIQEAKRTLAVGKVGEDNFQLHAMDQGDQTVINLNRFQAIRLREELDKFLGYD